MLIEQPPYMYRMLYPETIWRIPRKHKTVYLTFDDGPVPEVTPWVLNILDHYNIKATFFCVGDNVARYKELYQEILDRGHLTGNHTQNHIQGMKYRTKNYLRNVEAADTLMKEVEKFVSEKVMINNSEICFYLEDYLLLSEYMQKEVLFYLLKEEKLSLKNIEEINKWIFSEKKNIKNSYKGIEFLKEYNKITFKKEKQEKLDVNIEITSLGRYKVNDTISINVIEKKDNIVTNLNELCYNIQRLPIYIRTRKNGDKILLKNGYKKVKDLLIDEKIGVSKRDNILLALDNEGNVLSVLGIKKSEILKQMKDNNIIIKVEESYE